MSYTGLLVNLATISRPAVTYSKGRVSSKAYTIVDTKVPCNIQLIAKEALTPYEHGYEDVEGWQAFFEYSVDLLKDDRIVDERGRTFIAQSAPIDVTGRKHHVEVKLEIQE